MTVAVLPSWNVGVSVAGVLHCAPGSARSRAQIWEGAGSAPAQSQVSALVLWFHARWCLTRACCFFRTSFTKRSISLFQQRSREKKFPKSLVRLPVGWRRRAMQLQQRYYCVQSGHQSAVTDMEVTTETDRAFVILFLRVSCFLRALCTEQNKELS